MAAGRCVVCGTEVTATTSALCGFCDGPFHLQVRQDQPVEECGAVWVVEPYMTLQYACNACLGRTQAQPEQRRDIRRGRAPSRRRYRKVS